MSDFKIVKLLGNAVVIDFPDSINYTGAYNGATAYITGDAVSYNGSSYVALGATTGNLPTDVAFWQLLAAQGATGATGAAGANGADGADGADGQGVATGGTTGQVLTKNSNTDFDTGWTTPSPGVTDHTLLSNIGTNTHAQIDTHIGSTSNPHSVTKSQVGLSNVDNTSDVNKPVSTAQQTALNLKENSANKTTNFTGNTGSNTLFPTVKAVFDALVGYLAAYQPLLGYTPANNTLSNLSPTAINQALVPDSDVTFDLGSTINRWSTIYVQYMRTTADTIRFDIESGHLYDDSEKRSLSLQDRAAFDDNELVSIDWNRRRLYDNSTGNVSVFWNDRYLADDTGGKSLNWNSRQALDSGGVASVDWLYRHLLDDSELLAINYLDRQLLASDGSTQVLDFSSDTGPTTITQSPNNNSTKVATTAYVDAQPKVVIQKFITSGTWTKPTGAKKVTVAVLSGSGGGGSGRCGAAGTVRCGGGSGVASSFAWAVFDANDLAATVAVTVGAKGVGGAAVVTNDTNGNAGTAGGESRFGTFIYSRAAAGGSGGTASAGSGGVAQTVTASINNTAQIGGVAAQAAGGTGVAGGSTTAAIPTTGGSGGGVNAANTAANGGAGGARTGFGALDAILGGVAGTVAVKNGGNGNVSSGKIFFGLDIGTGGGGGAGQVAAQGGNGGNAGGYGASGGGGGGGTNTFGSGKGGDGFDGVVIVMTEF